VQNPFIMTCDLLTKTLNLLEQTDASAAEICAGANVGQRWLYDLRSGRYSDPGVTRIQRIHDFLVSRDQQKAAA
jgi:hypothetical protein